jgi:hypothetical protein
MSTSKSDPVYLNDKEVAAQLGRSRDWVRAHSRQDSPLEPVVPCVKILGRYKWIQADIDKFLQDNTVQVSRS